MTLCYWQVGQHIFKHTKTVAIVAVKTVNESGNVMFDLSAILIYEITYTWKIVKQFVNLRKIIKKNI